MELLEFNGVWMWWCGQRLCAVFLCSVMTASSGCCLQLFWVRLFFSTAFLNAIIGYCHILITAVNFMRWSIVCIPCKCEVSHHWALQSLCKWLITMAAVHAKNNTTTENILPPQKRTKQLFVLVSVANEIGVIYFCRRCLFMLLQVTTHNLCMLYKLLGSNLMHTTSPKDTKRERV